jgi:hypothetical protein
LRDKIEKKINKKKNKNIVIKKIMIKINKKTNTIKLKWIKLQN